MFDDKVDIRKYYNNKLMVIGRENEKLLKLKGTSI